jgi:Zn finger protein HypA/HybF involved in hydrogenase expression
MVIAAEVWEVAVARSWTDEDLVRVVGCNNTIAGALRGLGLTTSPGNYRTFHVHVGRMGLDTSHFTGKAHLAGKARNFKRTRPLSEILVENSTYTNSFWLKTRLVRAKLLVEQCAVCSLGAVWAGKPLVLQLDHINGNSRDHRLENLRLLCPNCHSQTLTFTGKTLGRYQAKKQTHTCLDCGRETSGARWVRCAACSPKAHARPKIEWPAPLDLLSRVQGSTYAQVGRELGVSGVAVKKHLRTRGLL